MSTSKSTSTRRRRRRHPGVVLLKPDAARRIGWRARYQDPDSGRTVKETLPASLSTVELREDWAVRKSKALALRRLELEGGAQRTTGTGLDAAIKSYFDDHPHLSRETLYKYKAAADKLLTWARKHAVKSADDLTGPKLAAFRASLVKEPRRAPGKGRRGARVATDKPRSPSTVNIELRSIGTILEYIRKLGLLPRLTNDGLRDGLQKLKAGPTRTDYLKPHELQKLLEAALRHDAETFKITRDEHDGKRPIGSTLRHPAIAPVIAGAIFTGYRIGHLLELTWEHVDLDALDHHGNVVGEIVPPAGSSTKRTGIVGLEVSPALRKMLAAMRVRSGGKGHVFKLTREETKTALRRLVHEYGAPKRCTWQVFRKTCGSYLTNAPGIFGAASAYRSAKQLGHSVQVAEKHYVGVIRGIRLDARTLEAAMQIEKQMDRVVAAVTTPAPAKLRRIG